MLLSVSVNSVKAVMRELAAQLQLIGCADTSDLF